VAFRREAFVPRGGPSGGDGGRGGDVILLVDVKLVTLTDFISGTSFRAENGKPGSGSKKTGRSGRDLVLSIPPGTIISDLGTGEVLADMTDEGQTMIVARGGSAGHGNARFATSRRQAPRFSTPGRPGEQRRIAMDLKIMADIGLVGFPNAGKSTLLSVISAARPKIGNFPFTTLHPCLGVVRMGLGSSFVVADLPGLIEGASEGAGLGLRFLRHVERTSLLVFLLAPDLEASPSEQLVTLRMELAKYSPTLAEAEGMIVLSKSDTIPPGEVDGMLSSLPGGAVSLSAATGEGVDRLLSVLWERVKQARTAASEASSKPAAGAEPAPPS